MADKEPKENQKTPNVNFISFQKQLRGIVKDVKEHNKKTGLKKILVAKLKICMSTEVFCKKIFQTIKKFQSMLNS